MASASHDSPVLVLGAGLMGAGRGDKLGGYLEKLRVIGIDPSEITVVDPDVEKIARAQALFTGIATFSSIPKGIEPSAVFVLSNTPAHQENLLALAELRAPRGTGVLVEKPLCTVNQYRESPHTIQRLVHTFPLGYTAYLIEFSAAFKELMSFIVERDLVVIGGSGVWHKNRMGDTRGSAGDLEDEMTHQLSALITLAQLNQTVTRRELSADLEYLTFVDPKAQHALCLQDPSTPLSPDSSCNIIHYLHTDRTEKPVRLDLKSSFLGHDQRREITVLLSEGGATPHYSAKLQFDLPKVGDHLHIYDCRTKPHSEIRSEGFPTCDKLMLQTEAFLGAFSGEDFPDPSLKTLSDGLNMVKLSDAAFKSHENYRSGRIDI